MIPWETELRLSQDLVASLLHSQFPHLKFRGVRHLDSGWDCSAYETDTGLVFKFPKRLNAVAPLLREKEILGALTGVEAIPIPKILCTGMPSEAYPAPFTGYKKLGGRFLAEVPELPGKWLGLARQAGQFLNQLRESNPAMILEGRELFSATYGQVAEFPKLYHAVKPLLKKSLTERLKAKLENFSILPAPDYPACFTHSDLSTVHILMDEASGAFSGVIDWADMALCNPLVDFVGFYAWGGEHFFEEMLPSYRGPVDEEALPWLKQRTLVHGLFEAYHSLETKNLKDRQGALQALETALT